MRRNSIIFCLLLVAPALGFAAPSSKRVVVNLAGSGIDDVDLLGNDGTLYPGTVSSEKVSFTVPNNKFSGASLVAFKGGQLVGSVGVVKAGKLRFRLSGSPKNQKNQALNKLTVKLNAWTEGASYVTTSIKGKIFAATGAANTSDIKNLGLNIGASQTAASRSSQRRRIAAISGAAADSDGDTMLDLYDVDADGDGIIDIADASVQASGAGIREVSTGVALPFTTLFLSVADTVNWHINGQIDSTEIDSIIGGENKFSIAFFFGFPGDGPDADLATSITGGYAVCPDELEYCRPTSVGASSGVYSGFSDGNSSIQGQLWSSLTASGHENSLESLSSGQNEATWAAAIQPRVGGNKFRPGDTYRMDFVNSSDEVLARQALTLPPYFVTVPALRAYNTTSSDAGADVLVDYSDSNTPGSNMGNPIVLASAGDFAGKVRFNVWRLQRAAVSGLESGDYRDFGHLNYGVIISNNSGEFTCGGLFEGLSSSLTELPSQGTGGSFQSNAGALLWPLVDSADDYEPSAATDSTTVGNNTISFTVDLSDCLARNSLTPGTHMVTLTAAGADTGHGSNRGAQMIYVSIP